jgi:plastocyanin
MSKRNLLLLMLSFLLAFSISCASEEDDDAGEEDADGSASDAPASSGPKYTSTGKEGTLTGVVKFEGAPPAPSKIQMEGDDFCAKANPNATSETVVINGDKLQNVIVYVKEGPVTKFSFDPSTNPTVLDQKNCQYTPHVVSLQARQQLKITTSDDTTHNVHPTPKNNKEWNKSQPPKGEPIVETFARSEVIPVKCNQHPWMKAFIGVFNHPFHAVTDKDGKYEIKGLPAGEYTIEFWHEKLGSATEKVTVSENGTQTLDFSSGKFTTKSASNSSGIKLGAVMTLSCCQPGHEKH